MNKVQVFALLYLVLVAGFAWGWSAGKFQVFPQSVIDAITEFVVEDSEDVSVGGKLLHDLDITPSRLMFAHGVQDLDAYERVSVTGLNPRREPPLIRLTPDAPAGYRVVFGAMDFHDTIWGGLIFDTTGTVVHVWRLSADHLPLGSEPAHRQNLYGLALLTDGSVIFNLAQTSGGLVKIDYCGEIIWNLDGQFHHTVSLTDEEASFWTFEGVQEQFDHILTEVDVETGNVIRRIDMKDVREANPDIDIFHLQKYREAKILGTPLNPEDNIHGNDIEALPDGLAADFPGFEPGDLLLSFRVINQVSIIDPETLKIKWWRIGAWGKQHDPDWNPGGLISVFDNNPGGFGFESQVKTINPATMELDILLRGKKYRFFSAKMGRHQITPAGSVLLTSSYQGRILEVDREGDVVFEFINAYDAEKGSSLVMSDAFLVPLDFFGDQLPTCQESS